MHQLALRDQSHKPVAERKPRPAPFFWLPSGQISPLLQRKAACACGGGCPRCQSKLPIQTKLAVSQPGDAYEQEADRVAEAVVASSAPPALQRKCACEGGPPCPECEEDKEELIQRKTGPAAEEASGSAPDTFPANLGSGQPLDRATRAFMEPRFGQDFSQVRIHTGAQAAESARGVNALAYTVGRDIVFGTRQYNPETKDGQHLLAHELTHTLQQGSTFQAATDRLPSLSEEASTQGLVHLSSNGGASSSTIWREREFTDGALRRYFTDFIRAGRIEDNLDSDNKAREIVSLWQTAPADWLLNVNDKIWLIREMMSGFTGDEDEQAILALLRLSLIPEVLEIFRSIGVEELEDEIHGEEFQELLRLYRSRAQVALTLPDPVGGELIKFPEHIFTQDPSPRIEEELAAPITIDGVAVSHNLVGRCDLSQQAEIFFAYEAARAAVNQAIPQISGYLTAAKADTAILTDVSNPVTLALRATFGLPRNPEAHGLTDVMAGLEHIGDALSEISKGFLVISAKHCCPSPDVNAEFTQAVCESGAVASWYNPLAMMSFCPLFFGKSRLGQTWVLLHETAHRKVADARGPSREIYCHRGNWPPDWGEARFNAECYSGLVMKLMHGMDCFTDRP